MSTCLAREVNPFPLKKFDIPLFRRHESSDFETESCFKIARMWRGDRRSDVDPRLFSQVFVSPAVCLPGRDPHLLHRKPSANGSPVSGSPRFAVPDRCLRWRRISFGLRISEFLFGSCGFVSPVSGSGAAPIQRPLPLSRGKNSQSRLPPDQITATLLHFIETGRKPRIPQVSANLVPRFECV
jgi:hypothetical protein